MTVFNLVLCAVGFLTGINTLLIWLLWRESSRNRSRVLQLSTASQRLEREISQQRYALAMLRQLLKGMENEDQPDKTDEELMEAAVDDLEAAVNDAAAAVTVEAVAADEKPEVADEPVAAAEPARPSKPISVKGLKDSEILQFIKRAVKTNSLALHQQPIVSLPGRDVKYHEVFARIMVGNSYIPAKDFVSVAKSNNLISAIDNLLLLHCLQLLKKNPQELNTELFINVSAKTLSNKKYMDELVEFLAANPKLSSRLIFEMTQQDSITLDATTRSVMEGLSLLGCRFSMDQVKIFGIDMTRLTDQHISFVKMDAAAIAREMTDTSARKRIKKIKTTLDSQGVAVILEKVENEKQLFTIIDLHADYGQGYLFGAPAAVA